MNFEWDDEKREENVGKHGFDFADAQEIFAGPTLEAMDTREGYGEDRIVGVLNRFGDHDLEPSCKPRRDPSYCGG